MQNYLLLLGLLGVGWVLQLILAVHQMRRFYRRFGELRRLGRTAMGIGGSTYRGRAYALIASDSRGRVVAAEVMRGFTVFARPRPLTALTGWSLRAVSAGPPSELPMNSRRALMAAATTLLGEAPPRPAGRRRPAQVQLKEA